MVNDSSFLLSMSSYICRVIAGSHQKSLCNDVRFKENASSSGISSDISEVMLSNWLLWGKFYLQHYLLCASWLKQWVFGVKPWIYRILSDQLRPVIMLEEWRSWAPWKKEERRSPCTSLRILWRLGNHILWPSMHGILDRHLRTDNSVKSAWL